MNEWAKQVKTQGRHKKLRRLFCLLLVTSIACLAFWLYGDLFNLPVSASDVPWYLTLVNGSNPVPDNWEVELTELKNDERVDSRMYSSLQEMFDDCRADRLLPIVSSSYRTAEDQQRIFDEKVEAYMNEGYSEAAAEKLTYSWVAKPGYSEHQLGLAVDINSEDTSICSNQAVWNWIKEHCAEYGFILRYPENKEAVTGYSYEPWHFRYVGKDAAKTITDQGITLEEYIQQISHNKNLF